MVLGVLSPPWLCNRSRVALLFTAYGEERNSQGVKGRGRIKTSPGLVVVSLCGYGGLNLTPDSGWLVNSHRLDSEVKLLSVGVFFCLLNNYGMTKSQCRHQRKYNKMGFGIIPSTYTNRHTWHSAIFISSVQAAWGAALARGLLESFFRVCLHKPQKKSPVADMCGSAGETLWGVTSCYFRGLWWEQ